MDLKWLDNIQDLMLFCPPTYSYFSATIVLMSENEVDVLIDLTISISSGSSAAALISSNCTNPDIVAMIKLAWKSDILHLMFLVASVSVILCNLACESVYISIH